LALRTDNLPPGSLKVDFGVVVEAKSKVYKGHADYFSASWTLKKRLGQSRLSDVLSRRMALITYKLPPGCIKKTGEFNEEMFQGVLEQCELIICILGIKERYLHKVA
jgi:hypothetical protein